MRACFFEEAKKISKKSDFRGGKSIKIGAVAVFKNAIIAKSCNADKTHPLQKKYDYLRFDINGNHYCPNKIHAEMALITKICSLDIDFSKVVVYVYRTTKDGNLAMARPCKSCAAALRDLGVRTVCYTTDSGYCEERYEN